jgi:serine/threonine-protein kinase
MQTIGPYRLVKELGRGGMGVVFEAFDPAIGRTVALKVIRSQSLATAEEDAQLKLRFAREASAAGRLSHPNIVTVYQLGEHDGMQYLVMEYITGSSLEVLLAPRLPLSLGNVVGILTQTRGHRPTWRRSRSWRRGLTVAPTNSRWLWWHIRC